MATEYDMCVDYNVLCDVKDKLRKIEYDLINSTEQMVKAIRSSQGFLTGNQFEMAKGTTASCVEITRKTGNNIKYAMEYIEKLLVALEAYGKCSYNGGTNEDI